MTDELTVLDDRYQLEAVLGRGGMADVYRASDRVLSRPVAVKVLRDTTDDERDRRRFTAEARTLAGLSHPHLVMLLDAGITAERPYLVLELVEGPTLDQECRGRPQDPDRVAEIGAQLAEALAYAHDRGVVHRDVKPGNVLLGDDRVRLADFGIARLVGDTVRHTQTGQTIGTAAYLSPEQVRGQDVAPATDVYALGLVLLEALTGERAYPGSPTEAALARLSQPPPIPESLPAHWRDLLAAMTDLEPDARPSAAEVARRLRAPAGATTPLLDQPPAPDRTAVMSAPLPAAATPQDGGGEALDRVRTAYAGVPTHLRAVVAVLVVLVLLVVVVALAAGPDDSGSGTGDDIPARTPPQLRDPLRDLHDAVEGGS